MNRFFLPALLVVVVLAASATAGGISYQQNFTGSSGIIATNDGDALSGCPNWTYNESGTPGTHFWADSYAELVSSGTLGLSPADTDNAATLTATITAQAIAGQSVFETVDPLTVSGSMGGIGGGGDYHVSSAHWRGRVHFPPRPLVGWRPSRSDPGNGW